MTFEEFQATGCDVADLKRYSPDIANQMADYDAPRPGRVYAEFLYIEREPDGRWYLLIANEDWLGKPLATLERRLYDFGVAEGYFE